MRAILNKWFDLNVEICVECLLCALMLGVMVYSVSTIV